MTEIFKTNVTDPMIAGKLAELICLHVDGYTVSFDLEDCDKILRVHSHQGSVAAPTIINLLKIMGFYAEILPDNIPSVVDMMLHETKYYPVLE
jgi:hypothetical protein